VYHMMERLSSVTEIVAEDFSTASGGGSVL